MAVNTIKSGFPMTLETDYTKYFTPASGVTVNQITIRQVEENIFYLYMSVTTPQIQANDRLVIGTIDWTYFGGKRVVSYLNSKCVTNNNKYYPALIEFAYSGDVYVTNYHSSNISGIVEGMGNITRREA